MKALFKGDKIFFSNSVPLNERETHPCLNFSLFKTLTAENVTTSKMTFFMRLNMLLLRLHITQGGI